MQKRRKKKKLRPVPLALMGVLCLGVIYMGARSFSGADAVQASGVRYLESQEQAAQPDIQSKITTLKLNQLGEAIESGETTIYSAFSDAVLFGDSRVVGFDVYGLLPSKQVFAAAGYTIRNITEFVDNVAAMQPAYIYLSYGVNDMGLEVGSELGENGYAQVYKEQIDALLAVSPHSKIVVNSIIECTPATIKTQPRWGETGSYNQQIKQMCADNGWIYVNNSTISKGGKADIYSFDGIHFVTDFYPVWAENMIRTALPDVLGGVKETSDLDTNPETDDEDEDKDAPSEEGGEESLGDASLEDAGLFDEETADSSGI